MGHTVDTIRLCIHFRHPNFPIPLPRCPSSAVNKPGSYKPLVPRLHRTARGLRTLQSKHYATTDAKLSTGNHWNSVSSGVKKRLFWLDKLGGGLFYYLLVYRSGPKVIFSEQHSFLLKLTEDMSFTIRWCHLGLCSHGLLHIGWPPSLPASCATWLSNGEINDTRLFSNHNMKEIHIRLTSYINLWKHEFDGRQDQTNRGES